MRFYRGRDLSRRAARLISGRAAPVPVEGGSMRRVVVGIALAGLTSMSLSAALKEGQKAPEFSAKASLDGKEIEFSLANALKKGPVVVYFYPSAFTGGCNI
jgi:thioredoxin-dependent peroxiredoxin